MRGTRAKQIRRAAGLNVRIFRAVSAAAMEDGHPEEIYGAEFNGHRQWDGRGGHRDEFMNLGTNRKAGKHNTHTPPEVIVTDNTGLFYKGPAVTAMFRVIHNPEMPKRPYANFKRAYKSSVRAGKREWALTQLATLEAARYN